MVHIRRKGRGLCWLVWRLSDVMQPQEERGCGSLWRRRGRRGEEDEQLDFISVKVQEEVPFNYDPHFDFELMRTTLDFWFHWGHTVAVLFVFQH